MCTHTQTAADKWGQTAAGMAISALILTGRNSKVLLFRCSPIHLLDSTHQMQPSLGSTLTEMASSREDSHTRGKAETTLEDLQLPPPRTSPSRNTQTTHKRAHTNCTHAHRHTTHTHLPCSGICPAPSVRPQCGLEETTPRLAAYLPPSPPPPLAHHSLCPQVCSPPSPLP